MPHSCYAAVLVFLLVVGNLAHGDVLVKNHSRIVLVGDSITDGDVHRLLVRDALDAAGLGDTLVFNAGVAGNTAAQMLERFERDVLVHDPDIVTINAGVNDAGRGVPIDDYARDLEAMIDLAGNHGAEVVLVTPTPIVGSGRESVVRYAEWMRGMAAKRNLVLADAHKHLAEALTTGKTVLEADNVHPNLAGQRLIARAILDALGKTGAKVPDQPEPRLYPGTIREWWIKGVGKDAVLTADIAQSLDGMAPDFQPLLLPQQPGSGDEWTEFARSCGVAMSLKDRTNSNIHWCVATWTELERKHRWLNTGGTISKLFLNGEEIELHPGNGWHPGKQRIRVLLNKGQNHLVVEARGDLWIGITDTQHWD